ALHTERFPNYDKSFNRPTKYTAREVCQLLRRTSFPGFKRPPRYKTIIPKRAGALRDRAAKQGLVIVLDTFLEAGRGRGQITYRDVFDALCRSFSDHF